MNTISIELPDHLLKDIMAEAQRRQVSQTEIIIERLEERVVDPRPSLWERMKDLVINDPSLPSDLSTNPKYMEGYGRSRTD